MQSLKYLNLKLKILENLPGTPYPIRLTKQGIDHQHPGLAPKWKGLSPRENAGGRLADAGDARDDLAVAGREAHGLLPVRAPLPAVDNARRH